MIRFGFPTGPLPWDAPGSMEPPVDRIGRRRPDRPTTPEPKIPADVSSTDGCADRRNRVVATPRPPIRETAAGSHRTSGKFPRPPRRRTVPSGWRSPPGVASRHPLLCRSPAHGTAATRYAPRRHRRKIPGPAGQSTTYAASAPSARRPARPRWTRGPPGYPVTPHTRDLCSGGAGGNPPRPRPPPPPGRRLSAR